MFAVAVMAAIIASQAMISGTFSIIQQSLALSCFPRVKIFHTSNKYEGQVGSSNQPPVLSSVGASSSNAGTPASGADQAGPTNMRNRGFKGQLFNLDLLMNSFQNLQSGLSEINEPSRFHCMKVNGDLLELSCLVYSNSGIH